MARLLLLENLEGISDTPFLHLAYKHLAYFERLHASPDRSIRSHMAIAQTQYWIEILEEDPIDRKKVKDLVQYLKDQVPLYLFHHMVLLHIHWVATALGINSYTWGGMGTLFLDTPEEIEQALDKPHIMVEGDEFDNPIPFMLNRTRYEPGTDNVQSL
jgi:hypothetical protein